MTFRPLTWFLSARVLVAGAACGLLAACAASSGAPGAGGAAGSGAGGSSGAGGAAGAGGTTSGGSGGLGGFGATGGGGSSGGGPTLLYAHTNTTLFKVDPSSPTLAATQIGDFDCIGGTNQDSSMTDLAVDRNGKLWGVSQTAFYELGIQGSSVHCVSTTPLNNPNGVSFYALTFAPKGVLDPSKEVLVAGNSAGELWEIDSAGNLSQHGTFGNVPSNDGHGHSYAKSNVGRPWELSGDIVFLENGGNPVGFATVRDCPNPPSTTNCDTTDTLIEINVPKLGQTTTGSVLQSVRGLIVKRSGCSDNSGTSYGKMYGIAALGSKVYGFSHNGAIFDINNTDGGACLVRSDPNNLWSGAGVTTQAKVVVPQ